MTDNTWSFNPINLFTPLGHLFTYADNSSKLIKRPDKAYLKKSSLYIFEMDGVLLPYNNSLNIVKESFNLFKKNSITPTCILTDNTVYRPKIIKKQLKNKGYKLKDDTKVINSGYLTLKYLQNKVKQHPKIINQSNKIVKIGIIGEADLFHYIKNKFKLELPNNILLKNNTKKIKFYWIQDNILPNNMDFMIFSILKNNQEYKSYLSRSIKWIKYSPKTVFLLTSSNNKLNEIQKDVKENIEFHYPLEIFNSVINLTISKNPNLKNEINKNYILTSKQNKNLVEEVLEEEYGIELDDTSNPILMIGDNLDTDLEFSKSLKCDYCLVLTGQTKYNQLQSLEQKKIDEIKYIVPDTSYCLL